MLWLIHGRSTLHRSYAAWSLEQNIIWYCFFKNWTLVRIECHSPSHCIWLASLCCSSPTLKCDLSFSCYRTAEQSVYKCNKVACVCVCVYLRLSWSSSAWRTAPVMGSTVIASPGFTPRMHCVSGIRPTFLPGNWAAGHATHTYTHTRTHTPEWDRDRQTEAETQEECTSS